MKILVVNAGSSSLKFQLLDMTDESVIAKGVVERIGLDKPFLKYQANGNEVVVEGDIKDHNDAINIVLKMLVDNKCGVITNLNQIAAVGHRVVHAAEDLKESVIIDDRIIDITKANCELAPLHNPSNLLSIYACQAAMPNVPMVAVFDTAFHSNMPKKAFLYAIPYEAYTKHRIRKYGFHGTSHMFVSQEAARFLNKDIEKTKIITCHLGNGSSITAVDGGISVDTSMGFTPLEGLPMGTRSGDIDPAVIEYLMSKTGMDINDTLQYLNKKSGMLGLSGISSDFRDLLSNTDNDRCKLAIDIFTYKVRKYIGSYIAAMGGLDAIVFTAGVGENNALIRKMCLENLEFLGIDIDTEKNNERRSDIRDVSTSNSKVKVLVIPTNEELVIARQAYNLVK